ncbi:hypothetical protein ABUE34_12850 [Kozakia baliensis]|uniref:hypothetical protein n=1 Tax=Kozakia baliensis TaxID=153496 RepID=UPI00345C0859
MSTPFTEDEDGFLCAYGPERCLIEESPPIRTLDDLMNRYDWLCANRPEFVNECQGELL